MTITLNDIKIYPIKGMNGQSLAAARLETGRGLPDDRRYAIAQGATRIDSVAPEWLPKARFFQLARNERLAMLQQAYDPAEGTLTISRNGRQMVKAKISEAIGRAVLGDFLASFLASDARGRPQIVDGKTVQWFDAPEAHLSIQNRASIDDLARINGKPVEIERFRGNLVLEGAEPWAERSWIGKRLKIGKAVIEVIEPIERCAATEVNPQTGQRDLPVVPLLRRGYNMETCGVYARVIEAGDIAPGDAAELLE